MTELRLSGLRGCEDATCERHRALAGSRRRVVAMKLLVAFVTEVTLMGGIGVQTVSTERAPSRYLHAKHDYIAVFIDSAGGAPDPVIEQVPAVVGYEPFATWTLLVRASGTWEVVGNEDDFYREYLNRFWSAGDEYCATSTGDYLPLAPWASFIKPLPPCTRIGSDIACLSAEIGWELSASRGEVVIEQGTPPAQTLAIWQRLVNTIPPCAEGQRR